VAFNLVPDATKVIAELLPNARITSGMRGPNHPLSRKNPRSFHKTGAAVDIAPIPGMTFEQAAARLRAAGYKVHPDSRDEVKNPSKAATGPHWHFVIGK
jgi:soluble lytic murein transglycosylase